MYNENLSISYACVCWEFVRRREGGGVSARSRKCGGRGGGEAICVGKEPFIDRDLCLLIRYIRYSLIYSTHNGDDAPQNSFPFLDVIRGIDV